MISFLSLSDKNQRLRHLLFPTCRLCYRPSPVCDWWRWSLISNEKYGSGTWTEEYMIYNYRNITFDLNDLGNHIYRARRNWPYFGQTLHLEVLELVGQIFGMNLGLLSIVPSYPSCTHSYTHHNMGTNSTNLRTCVDFHHSLPSWFAYSIIRTRRPQRPKVLR